MFLAFFSKQFVIYFIINLYGMWCPCEIIFHSCFSILSAGPSACISPTGWFDRHYIHHGGKLLSISYSIIEILLMCYNGFWDKFFAQVLVRLVGADDHAYPNFIDVMQWLAETNLLEMIVDKLNPSVSETSIFWVYIPLTWCSWLAVCCICN